MIFFFTEIMNNFFILYMIYLIGFIWLLIITIVSFKYLVTIDDLILQ